MFIYVSIILGGIAVGYLLHHLNLLPYINKSLFLTVLALLFVMGVNVGTNPNVMNHLDSIGLQSLLFAIVSTMGSVLAGWGVYVFFFKNKQNEE